MHFNISFFAPKPTTTISARSFKKNPGDFAKLFDLMPSHGPTVTIESLFKLALDAGYGSLSSRSMKEVLGLLQTDIARLRDYQRARLRLLLSLFDINIRASLFEVHGIAKVLEASEKSDASFILGSVGCRYATEEWLLQRKRYIESFWHYSTYSSKAVAKIKLSAPELAGKSRPDYLVRDNRGEWYALEAKGTFDEGNWSTLRDGLKQAWRLKTIRLTDPNTKTTANVLVSDFACALTHIENNRPRVTFVDPPAGEGSNGWEDAREDGDDATEEPTIALDLVMELAKIQRYFNACQQFRLLGRRKKVKPRSGQAYFENIKWAVAIETRRASDDVWIGILRCVSSKELLMRDLLVASEYVLSRYETSENDGVHQETSLSLDSLSPAMERPVERDRSNIFPLSDSQKRIVKRFRAALAKPRSPEEPTDWLQRIAPMLDVAVVRVNRKPLNVREFVALIAQEAFVESEQNAFRMEVAQREVTQRQRIGRFGMSTLSCGLVVASGAADWDAKPLTLTSRTRL
ncbi:hypothetical protein NOV72_05370 [Caballeronia novacaledonica]|uniref:Uncharacterized protein n=1 Tax=Caballeronia novacaledonica TaxID=1544861 RepID=A0A2U3ID82_9BURK|nr:hypothetical protein [Caballeronia novacaledonica]SPB18171.1 hypothetical protein NOV72_05370 [Caballeronia novacaledonica]